jgi:hypothetical protein
VTVRLFRVRGHGHTRRAGAWALVAGLALLLVAQVGGGGSTPPLFDGFIPEDPYLFLDPGPGQLGDPPADTETFRLRKGQVPDVIAATNESPPQAQVFANRGTFVAPAGSSTFVATIEPVRTAVPAPDGLRLVGNAYSISLSTSDGVPLAVQKGASATVVLRGPAGDNPDGMAVLQGTAWKRIKSQHAGLPSMRLSQVKGLGTFVLLSSQPAPSPSGPVATPGPTVTPLATLAVTPPTASVTSSPAIASPALTPAPSGPATPTAPGAPAGGVPPLLLIGVAAAGGLLALLAAWRIRRRRSPEAPPWGGTRNR